jgi:hypothetical protein
MWTGATSICRRAREKVRHRRAEDDATAPEPSSAGGHERTTGQVEDEALEAPGRGRRPLCGVRYELPDALVDLTRRFGNDRVAVYIVGRDAVACYALADPEWVRRAEAEELVAAVRS